MGLLNSILKRQSGADIRQNGTAPVGDKEDLALRFLEHVLGALDILAEVRRSRESESTAETDADKKTN
jgi:hypothetical protein